MSGVVVCPRPAIGFKLIVRGQVRLANTLNELAPMLAEAHRTDTAARAKARTSLTRDRELTSDELGQLVELATAAVVGESRP